jgi:DNA-binding response OmpR family regulator
MAKIMIITDDLDFAESLAFILEPDGHSTTAVSRCEAAMGNITKNHPDLLLLDVALPKDKATCFDLAMEIRRGASPGRLPIIMLTGVNDEYPFNFKPQDLDSEWFPVSDLMEKPVDLPLLHNKITNLLARQDRQPRGGKGL